MEKSKRKIGSIIYSWLAVLVLISFIASVAEGLIVQNLIQRLQVFAELRAYINDFENDVDINERLYEYATWEWNILSGFDGTNAKLEALRKANSDYLAEVSIVNKDGIVTYSSDPEMLGKDLHNDKYLSDYLVLFEGKEDYYAAKIDTNPFIKNPELKRIYTGVISSNGDYIVLFGYERDGFWKHYDTELWLQVRSVRIGTTGFLMACHSDGRIAGVSYAVEDKEKGLEDDQFYAGEVPLPEKEGEIYETISGFYGQECYVSMLKKPDCYVIAAYPVAEANALRKEFNILYLILFVAIFAILLVLIYILMKNHVVKEIRSIHGSLKRITEGDLDEKADAKGSIEFYDLSRGINDTVSNLKDRIQAAREQMAAEIENARQIQESAVPQVFPEDQRFELYASMNTAEAVGGDFYDFFMTDENTLAVVMADVSGKGMPAALYMMRAKTLIKTYAGQGLPVDEVAAETNKRLCADTSQGMFVTAWIGFLDLSTGVMSYVHAGHTMPVLLRGDHASENAASFVKQKINTVLGGLRKARYMRQEITLQPGDSIFLYTDGVTEAHDVNNGMYGEERLLTFIEEKVNESSCKASCEAVLSDVAAFSDGAKQFDDITMMWVRYKGK